MGDWYDVPINPEQSATESEHTRVARIEPYIDEDGTIRKALSYGSDKENLGPWYNLEDIKKVFPRWKIPDPSRYFNNKKFNPQARRDLAENRKERKKYKTPPIDQSNNDIQGGRGRGRGRGFERGTHQPQYGGRGRPTYSEEYREWDANQSAKPSSSSRRTHEEETWQEYREYKQDSDSPGYFTREFEDRKRARSPSPRGERPNGRDMSYERQGSRRDHNQESRRDYRRDYSHGSSRRGYSPERQSRRDYSPGHRQDGGRGRSRRDYTPEESRRYPGQNR